MNKFFFFVRKPIAIRDGYIVLSVINISAVTSEVKKMTEEYMKNMPKPPSYAEQLKALQRLVKIVNSMEKSETCPQESKGWPWGLPEDRPTQCKEALSAAACLGTHIQQLPKEKIPMVNASLHLIGQLLMDECDSKYIMIYLLIHH